MSRYRDHYTIPREGDYQRTLSHCWETFTYRRLEWLYGADRTDLICSGYDSATNADLAAWEALGEPKGGEAA